MPEVFAMTCGWMTMSLGAMLVGESGSIRIPVPCYLVRHPKGQVLFDTGLHKSMQETPAERLGVLSPHFDVHFDAGEDLAARLEQLGTGLADITYVVNSHLHFDHCGGNEAVTNSPIVVQRQELRAARDPELAAKTGYFEQDWDHGHDFILADGEFDLFGDGSVVCIPTPGHTPGHQSLRVRSERGRDLVLAGDACYLKQSLEKLHLPALAYDPEQMLESFRLLSDLKARGATIYYGHDPVFWEGVPQGQDLLA